MVTAKREAQQREQQLKKGSESVEVLGSLSRRTGVAATQQFYRIVFKIDEGPASFEVAVAEDKSTIFDHWSYLEEALVPSLSQFAAHEVP